MADPCVHGPGVLLCGHPDCVGERDFGHHPATFTSREARRKLLAWLDSFGPRSWQEVRAFLVSLDLEHASDALAVIEQSLRLNNPRVDLPFWGELAGSTWTSRGFDYCSGGHPGGDVGGLCERCGRVLDLSTCPHSMATSFCQACRIEEPYPIGV